MCGIAGIFSIKKNILESGLYESLERMTDAIFHRGPDDSGYWVDANAGIGLGFRRLAILDLSPAGHQPMTSADGRYVIVFNGEVYNFRELREKLMQCGHKFKGASDTEVVLAGLVEWGVEQTIRSLNGMFAIALWDVQEHVLYLVRDRIGIKPLYYGWFDGGLLFGSELKSLTTVNDFNLNVNRQALPLYLRYGYVPAPFSIYENVKKVMPGTIMKINGDGQEESSITYWSMQEETVRGLAHPFSGSDDDAVRELDSLLRVSVRERMIADVPLGAFLSGGVDSSAVVALMQVQSSLPVKTFTIGFRESGYNEAEYAKAVAQYLGTDHTELYVSPRDALNVIPKIPEMFDEPFGDSSQIPTHLVSILARQSVTVSLSGDGGDELFGGYPRYMNSIRMWSVVSKIPSPILSMAGDFLHKASSIKWVSRKIGTRMFHMEKMTKVRSGDELYWNLCSSWENPELIVKNGVEPVSFHMSPANSDVVPNFAQRMMYIDLNTYLPDDILVKLDRASMSASLEGRVPLLDDHRVVEFALRVPLNMKIRSGKGKWLLRQVLHKYVPQSMVDRPKMGFGVPIDTWLRGPLRDWAESLLNEAKIESDGYLNSSLIRQRWDEHLVGRKNWQYPLWYVLMFQSWLEHSKKRG